MSKKSRQMITGKSFEYALLNQFKQRLENRVKLKIIENHTFKIAENCFFETSKLEQSKSLLSASFAINFLIDIEPKLSHSIGQNDILELEIVKDKQGELGDVRDVLAIRLLQKWEIGISAKNNHRAVKHSRLSSHIDFGEKWLGIKVSREYFKTIKPIFSRLEKLKKESKGQKKWKELGDYQSSVYVPILRAFVTELEKLNLKKDTKIAKNLVSYLIGKKDFYKVIKNNKSIEIQAYNFNGTLSLPFKDVQPKYKITKTLLPNQILNLSFKKKSKTTIIVECDKEWVLSFRIHNASSRVEPSLKFDISLMSSPKSLFKNILCMG